MIQPILPVLPAPIGEKTISTAAGDKSGQFKSLLESALREVENSRSRAERAAASFLSGETRDLHSVLLDVQRAELTFDLLIQVKNKVTQAYQEIMRMPL